MLASDDLPRDEALTGGLVLQLVEAPEPLLEQVLPIASLETAEAADHRR
jgi:hypothetical protein